MEDEIYEREAHKESNQKNDKKRKKRNRKMKSLLIVGECEKYKIYL